MMMGQLKIILAVSYLIAAFFWSMPQKTPLRAPVVKAAEPLFQFFSLWQGWNMFAPDPIKEDIFLSVAVTFVDGSREERDVTRMNRMNYFTRYQRERWRKFGNDRLRLDSNRHLWPAAAKWFAKDIETATKRPVAKIEFIRHWQSVSLPHKNSAPARPPWQQYMFYAEVLGPST